VRMVLIVVQNGALALTASKMTRPYGRSRSALAFHEMPSNQTERHAAQKISYGRKQVRWNRFREKLMSA
jgi:hypothetical protein